LAGVQRSFGSLTAVKNFNLEMAPGERVALWGPNGSGKTTVLRCVAGTLEPDEGTIDVYGSPAGSKAARSRIGVVMSAERSFYLRLSGRANLRFFSRLRYGDLGEAGKAVSAIEEELELSTIADRRADRCSTGMLQQLAFGRSLLGDPQLLLLDEPTRSLDEAASERLWGAIDRRPDVAVLIATHRHEDLEHCGTRIDLSV
jgi:ABC-type multidrug transport system ATPase subunit